MISECTLETIMNIIRTIIILAVLVLASCGTATPHPVADVTEMPDMGPATFPMTAKVIAGQLHVALKNDSLVSVEQGPTVDNCRKPVATNGQAMVVLGDAGVYGALWLRQGTEIRLAQSPQGDVVVKLGAGEARAVINPAAPDVKVLDVQNDVRRGITGEDVMMYRKDASAPVQIVHTAARSDLAFWTIQMLRPIVDEMRDPALLEWQQGQMFKLRVFPIEAKSHKRIVLRFLSTRYATGHLGGNGAD